MHPQQREPRPPHPAPRRKRPCLSTRRARGSDATLPTTTSKDMKNPTAETKPTSDSKTTTGEMKADGKTKPSDSAPTSTDLKTPPAETKPSAFDGKTTGNAATSATAAPPAEKRTQI